jgi:TPR repeat protein
MMQLIRPSFVFMGAILFCSCESKNKQAVKTLRLRAENGDAYSQFQLGVCYSGGKGVPKDRISKRQAFNQKSALPRRHYLVI